MAGRARVAADTSGIDNALYDALHDGWWDPDGAMGGLHQMAPIRTEYFGAQLRKHFADSADSLELLEVGCGGGVLCESLAQALPAVTIVGVDISEPSIKAAETHLNRKETDPGLAKRVSYRVGSAYALPFEDASFDCVVIADVLEHLEDLETAFKEIQRVLRPNGLMLFDTFNRTFSSYLLAIFVCQTLFRLLPDHTHVWQLFVRPSELDALCNAHGLRLTDLRGFETQIRPWDLVKHVLGLGKPCISMQFSLSDNIAVQYFGTAVAQGTSHDEQQQTQQQHEAHLDLRSLDTSPPAQVYLALSVFAAPLFAAAAATAWWFWRP